jgi:ADP-ribose pyrophosphatase YjhB (NUDIX family)
MVGFDGEGRILMLKHVYHPTVRWGIPGGWLNRGEAPAACALRELEEETGLSAVLGPIVYVSKENTPQHIGITYKATILPGEINLNSEILAANWYFPDALPEPILPFVRESISAAGSYPFQDDGYKRKLDE